MQELVEGANYTVQSVTNSIKQNISTEADIRSAGQKSSYFVKSELLIQPLDNILSNSIAIRN
jgi:hypothetical protein